MIETEEITLETVLKRAVSKAKVQNRSQLVSYTKQIEQVDPIHVFEAAKELNKDRIFWTSTSDQFYIVGIGTTHELVATENRFLETKRKFDLLLEEALIYNPYEVEGTGIVALGGMSFDPKRKRSKLWKNFQPSQFTVPEYTLTIKENKTFLTMTTEVNLFDTIESYLLKWNEAYKLLNKKVIMPKAAHIKSKIEIQKDKWLTSVKKATEKIKENKAKKIVLAREMRVKLNKHAEISPILQKLIDGQVNSYVFAFEKGKDCFIGATPERLVKLNGDKLLSTCLAGTAPRGKTKKEDERISIRLMNDQKNRKEHDYVVQMIRRSIEKYCTNIKIPTEPIIYPLKNLHHLYTPVRASLKNEYSIFNIIEKLHPTPALGGEPREVSLAFIRENESMDRGWYGSPIGWLDNKQNGEFAVAIRSGLIQQDEVSLFAGCGVMKDSKPQMEYEETNIKFLPMLTVLEDT